MTALRRIAATGENVIESKYSARPRARGRGEVVAVQFLDGGENVIGGLEREQPRSLGGYWLKPVSWAMTGRPDARYAAVAEPSAAGGDVPALGDPISAFGPG